MTTSQQYIDSSEAAESSLATLALADTDPIRKQSLKARARARLFPGIGSKRPECPKIDNLDIKGFLGSGGMGRVYKAYDKGLDRLVAVKLPERPDASYDENGLQREAQALARIRHPNVLKVHKYDVYEGEHYIVLDLIDGVDLEKWIKNEDPGWEEVLARYVEAGRGLAALHKEGLVHRDFKPANAVRKHGGAVQVIDLGLVAFASAGQPNADAPRSGDSLLDLRVTTSDRIIGTPKYMSPEQLSGRWSDRSDQFSFCFSLFEALYGFPPYPEPKRFSDLLLRPQPWIPRAPPADARPPAAVAEALLRGLSYEPAERFASMEELLNALAPSEEPPRGRLLHVLAVSALILLSILCFTLMAQPPRACAKQSETLTRRLAESELGGSTDELRRRARAAFERYASNYADSYTAACRRIGSQGATLDEVAPRQAACFEEQEVLFAKLLALVSEYADTLPAAIEAAYGLPPPAACVATGLEVDVPASDARREEKFALIRAEALVRLRLFDRARVVLDSYVKQADALDTDEATPRQLRWRARVLELDAHRLTRSDRKSSAARFESARRSAESAGDDERAARILVELADLLAEPDVIGDASAKLGRLSSPSLKARYELRLQLLSASRALDRGESDTPLVELATLLDDRPALEQREPLLVINALDVLGRWRLKRDTPVEGLETLRRARDLQEELLGPQHPTTRAARRGRCEFIERALVVTPEAPAFDPGDWRKSFGCQRGPPESEGGAR